MQEQYAQWVKETCACGACAFDAAGSAKYLVNRNIPLNIRQCRVDQPSDSMPQAGYLGEDYLRYRVLVLGKNPAWPKDTIDDNNYYKLLQSIHDSASLQEHTPALRIMHNNWTPLRKSELDLLNQVGLKPTEIAYSNQILCRTDHLIYSKKKPNATRGGIRDIQSKPKIFLPIYNSCFHNRVCKLIEILEPNHILTIGRLDNTEVSWPNILAKLLGVNSKTAGIRVWPVRFPTGQGGLVKQARADISGLSAALGIEKKVSQGEVQQDAAANAIAAVSSEFLGDSRKWADT